MGRRSTAKTPEAREDEMIALATNLAEQQLRDGTAPAPLVNMLVRAGQRRERAELEQKKEEIKLLQAKVQALETTSRSDEKLDRIYDKLRIYSGQGDPEDYEFS